MCTFSVNTIAEYPFASDSVVLVFSFFIQIVTIYFKVELVNKQTSNGVDSVFMSYLLFLIICRSFLGNQAISKPTSFHILQLPCNRFFRWNSYALLFRYTPKSNENSLEFIHFWSRILMTWKWWCKTVEWSRISNVWLVWVILEHYHHHVLSETHMLYIEKSVNTNKHFVKNMNFLCQFASMIEYEICYAHWK